MNEIQEHKDVRDLQSRLSRLPDRCHKMLTDELINRVCFGHGPVDREWLDEEISSYERVCRSHERNIL